MTERVFVSDTKGQPATPKATGKHVILTRNEYSILLNNIAELTRLINNLMMAHNDLVREVNSSFRKDTKC